MAGAHPFLRAWFRLCWSYPFSSRGCELSRPETVRACAGGTPGLFVKVKLKAGTSGVIIRMYADWKGIYKQVTVPFVWILSRRIRQSLGREHPDLTLP